MKELFYQALSSPFGIKLWTSNPRLAINRLHAARKSDSSPELRRIRVIPSPFSPESEIYLVKEPENAKAK